MNITHREMLAQHLETLHQSRVFQADFTLMPPFSSPLNRENLREMLSLCLPMAQEMTTQMRRERNGAWRVQVKWHGRLGASIAEKWRTGAPLTDREQQVLNRAQMLVCDMPKGTDSERITWLAQRLHQSAVYEDPPLGTQAHRRAVDAAAVLLEGRGNCQAFADAFCLLAALCGFTAECRCGFKNRLLHLWNEVETPEGTLAVDAVENSVHFEKVPEVLFRGFALRHCQGSNQP